MNTNKLKKILDDIYVKYHRPRYLGLDPLVCVRRFKRRDDLEIVGLLSSALAYGRVEIIVRAIDAVIDIMGKSPTSFMIDTSYGEKLKLLRDFKHRFNDGADIAALLESAGSVMSKYGTLEKCFRRCMDKNNDQFKPALASFTSVIKSTARCYRGDSRSFEYLIPSPDKGSACKRMLMFMRWMIRRNDGIDLGVWKSVPASCLLIPVDTHVAQTARRYGLTNRNSADWKMSEEITAVLREFDPDDPVKYDFALCHAGMVDYRPRRVV